MNAQIERMAAYLYVVAALMFCSGLLLASSIGSPLQAAIGGLTLVCSFPVALFGAALGNSARYAKEQGGAMLHAGEFGAQLAQINDATAEAFDAWQAGNMRASAVTLQLVAHYAASAEKIARAMAEQFEE